MRRRFPFVRCSCRSQSAAAGGALQIRFCAEKISFYPARSINTAERIPERPRAKKEIFGRKKSLRTSIFGRTQSLQLAAQVVVILDQFVQSDYERYLKGRRIIGASLKLAGFFRFRFDSI